MHPPLRDAPSTTSTPLPPPPRRLAFWARGAVGRWFMRLFIMPHTIAGLFMLGLFLGHVAFQLSGINGLGHITAIESQTSRNSLSCTVHFAYDDRGQSASGIPYRVLDAAAPPTPRQISR